MAANQFQQPDDIGLEPQNPQVAQPVSKDQSFLIEQVWSQWAASFSQIEREIFSLTEQPVDATLRERQFD